MQECYEFYLKYGYAVKAVVEEEEKRGAITKQGGGASMSTEHTRAT